MACTVALMFPVSGWELTLELYPLAGGAIVNGAGGDAFTQPDAETQPYFYTAAVTHSLSGWHWAMVKRGTPVILQELVRLDGGDLVLGEYLAHLDVPVSQVSEGILPALTAALAQLVPNPAAVVVSMPGVVNGRLNYPLIVGDSYLAAHGRALTFSSSAWPDLTGAAVQLLARKPGKGTQPTITITGSVATPSGPAVVRFEPTAADTAQYVPGQYRFGVKATLSDGTVATLIDPETLLDVVAYGE